MHALSSHICGKAAAIVSTINGQLRHSARHRGEHLSRCASSSLAVVAAQQRITAARTVASTASASPSPPSICQQKPQRRTMSADQQQSATAADKFRLPQRFHSNAPSVWTEYIQLAADYQPLNLGQGFTDYAVPAFIRDALTAAATSANPLMNQYTRGFGHPRLVKVLAELYTKLVGRPIDANKEVLVTVGAYEALYAAIQGHVEVGDEVITMEPFFDCYEPMIRMAGGVPHFIPLKPTGPGGRSANVSSADWQLDWPAFESLFNERTKMLIINTPNNPLGKVFTRAELERIAELCRRWNVLCVSDEVYEWLVYDGVEHVRICTLPGMWERTLTIGSVGKTFSVTGWKIGWAYGPAALMRNLHAVHQNSVYTCSTPTQEAIAIALETQLPLLGTEQSYFHQLCVELTGKRDRFVAALRAAGMRPTVPEGGFFVVADWSGLADRVDLSKELDEWADYRFTKWMTKTMGLQGIPPSAFYSEPNKHLAENYVRYCFFKRDETLEKAAQILRKFDK